MGDVTELSHTADVGFEVEAAGSPEELFELAATGLLRALGLDPQADDVAGERARTREMELSRPDLDRLLVAWLRELLHRTTRDLALPEAAVDRVDAPAEGAASLHATVRWRPAGGQEPEREIKGVTYHGLEVEERPGGWHARVVLDV